ncbi:hypothetical protein Nepgr_007168 [Nepenthes gracilis]|uniref:Uncharacterized protein n=1 Tax=Nepenthes gracilis TaxID=150966 RepID=A0AAD3S6C2_NEPGR|nr:hypothetical protein Nepgr_007168 [Nepenthes gracilis]
MFEKSRQELPLVATLDSLPNCETALGDDLHDVEFGHQPTETSPVARKVTLAFVLISSLGRQFSKHSLELAGKLHVPWE